MVAAVAHVLVFSLLLHIDVLFKITFGFGQSEKKKVCWRELRSWGCPLPREKLLHRAVSLL